MIKFNIKALFNKSKPEETSVTLTAELEKPETPKEIFDKSVASVVKTNLRDSISNSLFIMVCGQEVYEDTIGYIEELKRGMSKEQALNFYPKTRLQYERYDTIPTLLVSHREILDHLTELAYTQVYGETK